MLRRNCRSLTNITPNNTNYHKYVRLSSVAIGSSTRPMLQQQQQQDPKHKTSFVRSVKDPEYHRDKVDFGDPSCFSHKSTWELLRGMIVFRLCSIRPLVIRSAPMLKTCESIFGHYLTYETFVKWTFFSHFCAGTNEVNIRPALATLRLHGIGPILDYAAEADSVEDAPKDSGKTVSTLEVNMPALVHNNTISYSDDGVLYDDACRRFVKCIQHASQNALPNGLSYAAVKMTGLCDPQLLARVSAILLHMRRTWLRLFYDDKEILDAKQRLEDSRVFEKNKISVERFAEQLPLVVDGITKDEARAIAASLDLNKTGTIQFIDFTVVNEDILLGFEPETPERKPLTSRLPQLSEKEKELLAAMRRRARTVVEEAHKLHVRVMFDAEQTFYQKAIDRFVRELQREFNTTEPVVYNTYQAYLKITEERVRNDLERSVRRKWVWGGKLVRGAYLEQEAEIAQRFDYENPVNYSKVSTDRTFDNCSEQILKFIENNPGTKLGILFGTHNVPSLELTTRRTAEIQAKHKQSYEVCFAQLYGMGDHLTFPIANAGFCAFKYVPYGTVKETIQYLYRRALENTAMLNSPSSEKGLMWRELKGRFGLGKK
eukprot:PhM_4_TR16655/c0_g1_i1/m.70058/K00318/PRODH; proline dehydrogenase